MAALKDRLATALTQAQEKAPHKNKSGLAAHCHLSPSSMTDWFSGKTKTISYRHAVLAAEYLEVNASWLADGVGDMKSSSVHAYDDGKELNSLPVPLDRELVIVPQYNVLASAGPGSEVSFEEVTDKTDGFIKPRSWFQENRINPDNCKAFLVHGDSMEPYLWDGDKILVDCSAKEIISGKIYVFMLHGEMRVKSLRSMLTGGLVVISFNPDIPEERLLPTDLDTFRLIGRVRDREGNGWL